jgi:opacity protein-like surface antigen
MRNFLLAALVIVCGASVVYAAQVYHIVNPVTIVSPAPSWAVTGDQDSSTDTSLKAAVTGVRHCVTSVQVVAIDSIAADETLRLLSNDTVLWAWVVNATTTSGIAVTLPVPICTVSGEALEVDTAGDPTDNLIFYNVQGYSAN